MKNILIVVDMQNGFDRYEQTHILAKKVIELTNSGIFDKIIATRFLNKEGSQYTKFINWHRLMSSPDIDLVEGIKADAVVDKWVYTCVTKDFLELLKKCMKTATDLFEQSIMPIVLTEYCDSNGGPESHKAGIMVMDRLIGRKSIVPDKIKSKEDLVKIIADRQY